MTGEGHIEDDVWIVKSHFPERLGYSSLTVHKTILMVRSPIDSLWSLFNMMSTQSHTQSIPEHKISLLKSIWEVFLEDEIKTWTQFHEYWTKSPQNVPTYIVRYEDLLDNPYDTLINLFKFLMSKDDLTGTVLEKIINEVSGKIKPEVYKPRSGKINASYQYYEQKQIDLIRTTSYKFLKRFGYIKPFKGYNPTGFIDEDLPTVNKDELDPLSWIKDFNNKMTQVAIKLKEQFPEEEKYRQKVNTEINSDDVVDQYKDKKNQGWRALRPQIRKVMDDEQ